MPLSLVREEEGRPRNDRDAQIDEREECQEIVHVSQVEEDAEASREEFGREQPRTNAGKRYSRADKRVGLHADAPQMDADVREGAVEALDQQKSQHRQVAETARRIPLFTKESHGRPSYSVLLPIPLLPAQVLFGEIGHQVINDPELVEGREEHDSQKPIGGRQPET